MAWTCRHLAEAIAERQTLVPKEKAALINADAKLEALGPRLPYPHSSPVAGADRLHDLRPRGGRSPWRALYRQVGDELVVAAIAPEAEVDPSGFVAACRRAEARLVKLEQKK
jgi:hypothetical protein